MKTWGSLILAIVICLAAGGIGSLVMPGSSSWYRELNRPSFAPPNWLFGPVWTFLYLTMAIAAWNIWRRPGGRLHSLGLSLFAAQLILNAAWTPIFFGLHQIGWAMIVLAAIWLLVLACFILFFRLSRVSGALLIPYLAWLSFAAVLNAAFWSLNR